MLLALLLPVLAHAQNYPIDSLRAALQQQIIPDTHRVHLLLQLSRGLCQRAPAESEVFAQEAVVLSDSLAFSFGRVKSRYNLGLALHFQNQYPASNAAMEEGMALLSAYPSKPMEANFHVRLGVNKVEQGRYDEALEHYYTNLRYWETQQHPINMGKANLYVAGALRQLTRFESALENQRKALKLFQDARFPQGLFAAYNSMSTSFTELNQMDSAIHYYEQALILMDRLKLKRMKGPVLSNMSISYYHMGEYEKALGLAQQAIELCRQDGNQLALMRCYNNAASCYTALNQAEKAIPYLEKAYALDRQTGTKENELQTTQRLADAYEQTGDLKQSLHFMRQHLHLKDSLRSERMDAKIAELETHYQKQAREQEIALQEQEIKVLTITGNQTRLQRNALVAGTGMIAIILSLFFNMWRTQQRHQRLKMEVKAAQDEQEIKRLANEVSAKNKQLTTYTMQLLQKKDHLLRIKEKTHLVAKELQDPEASFRLRHIEQEINRINQLENDWEEFRMHFEAVHTNFFQNLKNKVPALTPKDLRLCAFLRLTLTTKEIANLLALPPKSVEVARYRLRKKFGLDPKDNLVEFIVSNG
ncbi:MAG: tetratricopeptide repeat protein [Salibacteraceae bacterium]